MAMAIAIGAVALAVSVAIPVAIAFVIFLFAFSACATIRPADGGNGAANARSGCTVRTWSRIAVALAVICHGRTGRGAR